MSHEQTTGQEQPEQPPVFGRVVWEAAPDYIEYLLADERRARLVVGIDPTTGLHGTVKLFRLEWTEPDGHQRNKAVYHLLDAITAFQDVANAQQQEQEPLLTEEERLESQAQAHLDAAAAQRDLPIQYDLPREPEL